MQSIEVVLTAEEARREDFTNKIAVVIDILRASTTINVLFERGVNRIIPTITIEETLQIKKNSTDREIIIMGERGGIKPKGFDFGNSPAEIKNLPAEKLKDKTVVLTTTNGTKAINYSSNADIIIVASMLNITAVTEFLLQSEKSIIITCSGTNSRFSIEDFYAAGSIINIILNKYTPISDIAWLASITAQRPINDVVNEYTCKHLNKLKQLGFTNDIELALSYANSPLLPIYDKNEKSLKIMV